MATTETDIFISGGGLAGLAAAAAFRAKGFDVVLVDPAPPAASAEAEGSDLRSTALLQPAVRLFEDAGLWSILADQATPLETLRVIDTQGDPPTVRTDRAFSAGDLSEGPFGWNVANWRARKALVDHLHDRVDLRLGTGFARILTRDREAIVTLTDGNRVRARLAVAADGRTSPLRQAVGIDVTTTRYAQKALAFAVTHDVPHDCVSTEIYRSGGAFTLVPLGDHDGRSASAVVWMEDGPRAKELAGLPTDQLGEAATLRSVGILGSLRPVTPVRLWPVVTQTAQHLTARRVALVAEAAHVLPPIGAQGLNTSLHDVAELTDLAAAAGGDPGADAVLDAYGRKRARDIHLRARVIDLFNRVCRADDPGRQTLRSLGLRAVHDITPLRLAVMRAGLGS